MLSRKDLTSLEGAYAAADAPGMPTASLPDSPTDVGTYIVGNNIFNPALVPIGTLDGSVGKTLGFSFTGQGQAGFRVSGSTASGPGVIQNMSALKVSPGSNIRPVRVPEAPILSTTITPFTRTVAPLPSRQHRRNDHFRRHGALRQLRCRGRAAQYFQHRECRGRLSRRGSRRPGQHLRLEHVRQQCATSQMPLPTALGQSCLVSQWHSVPLLFVSNTQVNAQLPSRLNGGVTMSIHTPGGVSDNFNFNVSSTAPSVFTSGSVVRRPASRPSSGPITTSSSPRPTRSTRTTP